MESWSLDMREKPQDEKDRTLLSAQAKDNRGHHLICN